MEKKNKTNPFVAWQTKPVQTKEFFQRGAASHCVTVSLCHSAPRNRRGQGTNPPSLRSDKRSGMLSPGPIPVGFCRQTAGTNHSGAPFKPSTSSCRCHHSSKMSPETEGVTAAQRCPQEQRRWLKPRALSVPGNISCSPISITMSAQQG